ncbi:MAG: hypothetical protein GF393_11315, partial [Armatimonadia bacterium]|nr:hypothetical protein [Armatimonadia bacterium]
MNRTAIIVTLLIFALSLCAAQAQPAINHLSTDPILHEDGQAWHARVRFTTSAPAICRVETGADAGALTAGEPEGEALRNHRFDVPGERGQSVLLRIVAVAEDAEVTSDVIEVAPPDPFPRGNVDRVDVPLTV